MLLIFVPSMTSRRAYNVIFIIEELFCTILQAMNIKLK